MEEHRRAGSQQAAVNVAARGFQSADEAAAGPAQGRPATSHSEVSEQRHSSGSPLGLRLMGRRPPVAFLPVLQIQQPFLAGGGSAGRRRISVDFKAPAGPFILRLFAKENTIIDMFGYPDLRMQD